MPWEEKERVFCTERRVCETLNSLFLCPFFFARSDFCQIETLLCCLLFCEQDNFTTYSRLNLLASSRNRKVGEIRWGRKKVGTGVFLAADPDEAMRSGRQFMSSSAAGKSVLISTSVHHALCVLAACSGSWAGDDQKLVITWN